MRSFHPSIPILSLVSLTLFSAADLPAREEGELLWTSSFPGPVEGLDAFRIEARDIAVDEWGNVFVVGEARCPHADERPGLAALDEDGSVLWYALDRREGASEVRVASDGGIYAASLWDGITITKLDRSGRELWSVRDDAPDLVSLVEMAPAPGGGVFLLTEAARAGEWDSGLCSRTVRYDADGGRLWEILPYFGQDPPGGVVWPIDLAVDEAGCAHVLGRSLSPDLCPGLAVAKYSPAGEVLWVSCSEEEDGGYVQPIGMALSPDGAVYTLAAAGYEAMDPAVISKFESDGHLAWTRSFDAIVEPMGIAAGGSGAYVMGLAPDENGNWSGDVLTVKCDGGGEILWSNREEGDVYGEYPARLGIDATGNIYVSWIADGPRGRDTGTVKYDPDGHRIWRARYGSPGLYNDFLKVMAVGPRGHVAIGCAITISTAPMVGHALVAYDQAGARAWAVEARDSSDVRELPAGVAVDGAGDIYVAGSSTGLDTGTDYMTAKLGPGGEELWRRRLALPGDGNEVPRGIGVDAEGGVYVSGMSDYPHHFLTVKYDRAGTLLWSVLDEHPEFLGEEAADMAVDPAGNVYVTGQARSTEVHQVLTVKYDSGGSRLWKALYRGSGATPEWAWPKGVVLAPDGSVYVVVHSTGNGTISTVKYGSDGRELWVHRYGTPDRPREEPAAMCLDGRGNVCIAGITYLPSGEGSRDILTYAVSPDGRLVWEATYSGQGGNEDYPTAIAADAQGGVYITGSTAVERDPRAPRAVVTLAFDSRGRIVWEARYARPGSLFYRPSDLLVDSAGDVHVFVNAVSTSESVDLLLKYDRMGRLVWETEVAQLAAYQLDPQLAFHPSGDVIAVFDASYPGPCFDWPRTTVVRVTATEIPSAPFLRGEVTGDGDVDVADPICILNLLFAPESGPCEVEDCLDALDANDDGAVDLGDAVSLLMHLFAGGPEPAPPGPTACGIDRTEDWSAAGFDLGCDAHPACEERPAAR